MGLWQDLQFAIRLLVKDKWFTLVAATALALGIGVNTTVFTFVNAVLIRGLPFDDPDRIMALDSHDPVRDRNMGVSYLDFKDWREATQTFTGLAAYTGSTMNVSDEGRAPERFSGSFVSANAFTLIGQKPQIGRDFLPEDDRPGAPAVVLLGSGIWKNRYGSDSGIVGRTIRVNDIPSAVIGVMPEGFKFPQKYSVAQRTQEIGVRMALGAQSTQVTWLFLRRAFFHLGVGLTIGIAGALGVGKVFESTELLIQTSGRDPVTIVSIAALLAVVALAASVWPARRATRLDPLVALRRD